MRNRAPLLMSYFPSFSFEKQMEIYCIYYSFNQVAKFCLNVLFLNISFISEFIKKLRT